MHRYKVHHELFKYKLNPTSFRVYVTLSNMFYNRPKSFKIKLCNIAKNSGVSINTVQRCLKELELKRLIKKTPSKIRCKRDDITIVINGINQYELKLLTGKFTLIEVKLLKKIDNHSSFMLYFAVAKYANESSGRGFPSYRYLTELTGLSRSTVINKIKELSELCYIYKHCYIKTNNYNGHNNYLVFNSRRRTALFSYILVAYKNFLKTLVKNVENFVDNQLKSVENFLELSTDSEETKSQSTGVLHRAIGKVKNFFSNIPLFRKMCFFIE